MSTALSTQKGAADVYKKYIWFEFKPFFQFINILTDLHALVLGITYGTCSLRGEPHTDPHFPLKKKDPDPLVIKTPTLSLRVLCGCSVHAEFATRRSESSARGSRGPLCSGPVGFSTETYIVSISEAAKNDLFLVVRPLKGGGVRSRPL